MLFLISPKIPDTVFPHIVSAETILFWLWPYVLWPLISVHKCAETIQGRKLFKGGNYMRKYGFPHSELTCSHLESCSSGSIWALEGTELMRKCWISLKIILGTMYSATHMSSAGGSAGPWLALGPWCWEQKPDSRITEESPQSHAPPAWLLKKLKSWPETKNRKNIFNWSNSSIHLVLRLISTLLKLEISTLLKTITNSCFQALEGLKFQALEGLKFQALEGLKSNAQPDESNY